MGKLKSEMRLDVSLWLAGSNPSAGGCPAGVIFRTDSTLLTACRGPHYGYPDPKVQPNVHHRIVSAMAENVYS
jgi:hypothetical protein